MDMTAEIGILVAYAFGMIALYVIGYLFLVPFKFVLKLLTNSLLGGAFILLFNWVGGFFGYHIALNLISAITIGVLGLPGALLWLMFSSL